MTRFTSFAKVKVIIEAEVEVVLIHDSVFFVCKGRCFLSFCQRIARLFCFFLQKSARNG